jgi:LmbE family N-acetylglucosaminyl deacetylase
MGATEPLRLLVLGAHPDDAEYHAGGLCALYAARGHVVRMISVTAGDAGHQRLRGAPLAAIRREEARNAGRVLGAEGMTWDHADGRLAPTIELREQIIRELRTFRPDLVLTHRTNDYHPDHRAVGQAVQDASYLVTVPALVPEAPILARDPVVALLPDRFTRPTPMRADVVVAIDGVVEAVIDALACHASQFFEWLPFNRGDLDQVPADAAGRRAWLGDWYRERLAEQTERFRPELVRRYGSRVAAGVRAAEAFEVSEYARPLDETERRRLFEAVEAGPTAAG